jgi:hypothetical protein
VLRFLAVAAVGFLMACDPPEPAPAPSVPTFPEIKLLPFVRPEPSKIESPKDPPIERTIRLAFSATTWRSAPPYDIRKELIELLRGAGVAILESPAGNADGVLAVEYGESRGELYKVGTGGTAWGSHVYVHLDFKGGRQPAMFHFSGQSASWGTDSSNDSAEKVLLDSAVGSLKMNPMYEWVGHYIAAAAGAPSAPKRLVRGLAEPKRRRVILDLLQRLSYQPDSEEERGWLAVGRNNYDACTAVAPLAEVLESNDDLAPRALGRLGTPEAMAALRLHLSRIDRGNTSFVRALIEGLSHARDVESLLELERWSRDPSPAMAQLANRSMAEVWPRLPPISRDELKITLSAHTCHEQIFDIESALRKRLNELAVGGVLLLVDYEEEITSIRCGIQVLNAPERFMTPFYSAEIRSPTGLPPGTDLQRAAAAELLKSESFEALAHFVAFASGRRESAKILVPRLSRWDRGAILDLFARMKYEGSDESERAAIESARNER